MWGMLPPLAKPFGHDCVCFALSAKERVHILGMRRRLGADDEPGSDPHRVGAQLHQFGEALGRRDSARRDHWYLDGVKRGRKPFRQVLRAPRMQNPPAWANAAASSVDPPLPIAASCIGKSQPTSAANRVLVVMVRHGRSSPLSAGICRGGPATNS